MRRVNPPLAISSAGIAVALVFGLSTVTVPASAEPAEPVTITLPNATYKKVFPLPGGAWSWSANYGVAGPLWSSGYHTGQDLSAASGTPVLSAAPGVVIFTGNGGAYGNLVQVHHPDGVQSWYAHLSAITTQVGAPVAAGQMIGAVGSTGNSTGPHLHFEVRVNSQPVDPRPWLGGAPSAEAIPGVEFDPELAAALAAELGGAEAALARAQAQAEQAQAELRAIAKKVRVAEDVAEEARGILARYVREVYITGIEPELLLQTEALTAGDIASLTDREVLVNYANNSQNAVVSRAVSALLRVKDLQEEAQGIRDRAQSDLEEAELQVADLKSRLDASMGLYTVAPEFDGTVPEGGSKRARYAVSYAMTKVGSSFTTKKKDTGPAYSRQGLVFDAWRKAGATWKKQTPNDMALNTKWVAPIDEADLQPGDLIFWRLDNGSDIKGRIDHVGLVLDPAKGLFIHAASPSRGVVVSSYTSGDFYKYPSMFGRVLTDGNRIDKSVELVPLHKPAKADKAKQSARKNASSD